MGFYSTHILPWRLARGMDNVAFEEDRAWVTSHAHDTVVEIGFGSGLNLPFYTNITKLYGIDPSRELFTYATSRIAQIPFSVVYMQGTAEQIPLADHSVDAVVSTWTLCSIPNPEKALQEIHRILKPDGVFSFAEHGKSPRPCVYWWQRVLTPLTTRYDGNCHLDRDITSLIGRRFSIQEILTSAEKYKPLCQDYRGWATPKESIH